MVSRRPYRASKGFGEAIEEIMKNSGILYDKEVVAACIDIIEAGFNIERSTTVDFR
jgi:HD-GYP domain-containing protein (c-di-GMP phosphodiesterase class II)